MFTKHGSFERTHAGPTMSDSLPQSPLPFPLDASDTENSYPYLKHRFPGDEACFHWAGSFLTSNLGRGSSPRHLLITSDFEKLNVLPIPLAVVTNLGTEPLATFGGDL